MTCGTGTETTATSGGTLLERRQRTGAVVLSLGRITRYRVSRMSAALLVTPRSSKVTEPHADGACKIIEQYP